MRIVYDDAMQSEMVLLVERFMASLNVKSIVRYEWGMNRVQMHRLREQLNLFLKESKMSIGNTVTHAHGIGNNCQYPIYYHPEGANEIQQCGNININFGMYGEGFVSCEDYNGKRVGATYVVTESGVGVKRSEKK